MTPEAERLQTNETGESSGCCLYRLVRLDGHVGPRIRSNISILTIIEYDLSVYTSDRVNQPVILRHPNDRNLFQVCRELQHGGVNAACDLLRQALASRYQDQGMPRRSHEVQFAE